MTQNIAGFIAKTGVTYRVLMPYKGERHILLHLELTKDANLYLFDRARARYFSEFVSIFSYMPLDYINIYLHPNI